jgi:hypothetical protein
MKLDIKKQWPGIVLLALATIYLILKGLNDGNDINVYLFASQQLFDGLNIYADNPYNNYLYSPLFALLLGPLSILDMGLARVIWHLGNLYIIVRIWKIISALPVLSGFMNGKQHKWWMFLVFILSAGYINHNVNLGQVTFLILWLTMEGVKLALEDKKPIGGALMLALGINFKIIPLLSLFYLFFKGKYKAVFITSAFVVVSLFLPSLFVGHSYNMEMIGNWKETISPTRDKYVFEANDACIALNSILPAFLLDFEESGIVSVEENRGMERKMASIPYNILVIVLQALRLAVVGVFLLAILYKRKHRKNNKLWFYWEMAFYWLVTLLIFPHQMKYSMLYFVPVGAYILIYIFWLFKKHWDVQAKYIVAGLFSMLVMGTFSVLGRDIIGSKAVLFLGFYHFIGLSNLVFLGVLWIFRPDKLLVSEV